MELLDSRRSFMAQVGALACAFPFAGMAQTAPARAPHIGLLVGNEPDTAAAFIEGLASLGYVPDQNIILETRDLCKYYPRLILMLMPSTALTNSVGLPKKDFFRG